MEASQRRRKRLARLGQDEEMECGEAGALPWNLRMHAAILRPGMPRADVATAALE